MAKWVYLQQENEEASGSEPGFGTILRILKRRGVSEEEAEDFLSPTPKTTYDPFLMPDLKPCVARLLAACERGETICIYGDYDADGVTSCALMLEVLSRLTDRLRYHIPSRFSEGYGLNKQTIARLAEEGVHLILTVDCGSTSPEEAALAKELGMEIIISDHHTMDESRMPECLLLNPKRADSRYPFPQLSGCGVAFKIAQGLQRTLAAAGDARFTKKELDTLLDLVAISTVADIVPLLSENRTLVKYGLRQLNRHKRPGLNALLRELGLFDKQVGAEQIAYQIAPNINALGRMGTADIAVELLSSSEGDPERLAALARRMAENNEQRKAEQEKTARLCEAEIESGRCGADFPILYVPEGHEGVAGIVAGHLSETLYRPVCILTQNEDGLLKGTGRSVPGLNLYDLLKRCEGDFTRFGGHAGACGFSLPPEKLDGFRQAMQAAVQEKMAEDPELFTEKLSIEKELGESEKTLAFADALSRLEPFGEANERPLFSVCAQEVLSVRRMGSEGQHARFTLRGRGGTSLECVLFRRAEEFSALLCVGQIVDAAGELSVNEYNGTRRLQFVVRDLKAGGMP